MAANLGHPDLSAACHAGIDWACGIESIHRTQFMVSDQLSDGTVPGVVVTYWRGSDRGDMAPTVAMGMAQSPPAVAQAILETLPADVEAVQVVREHYGVIGRANR